MNFQLPKMFELVSRYNELMPTSGNDEILVSGVGVDNFVDFTRFFNLPLFFLSLNSKFQFCNGYLP